MDRLNRQITDIKVNWVVMSIDGYLNIGEAIQAALILCSTEWRNVVFEFNKATYRCYVNDLILSVKKEKGEEEDGS